MKKARTWMGLMILAGLVAYLLSRLSDDTWPRCGPVSGRIMYRGRPVRGGSIFFDSEDTRRSEGMCAPIDETGHFACDPEWRRDPTGRTRFRISVILDRRKHPSARRGDGPTADGIVGAGPVPSGEARPVETVLRAPMGTPERVSPSLDTEPVGQPALSTKTSTGLEVELGPEPAQLTIDWKD